MKAIKEIGISFVRTSIVPPAVGFTSAFLVEHNVTSIKSSWLTTVIAFVFSAIYYLLFRAVEVISQKPKVMKWVGIMLGYPRIEQGTTDVPVEVK